MAKAPLGEGTRFQQLERKLKGKVRDPGAVAASIGRKKWGKKRFQDMAAKGKKNAAYQEYPHNIASGAETGMGIGAGLGGVGGGLLGAYLGGQEGLRRANREAGWFSGPSDEEKLRAILQGAGIGGLAGAAGGAGLGAIGGAGTGATAAMTGNVLEDAGILDAIRNYKFGSMAGCEIDKTPSNCDKRSADPVTGGAYTSPKDDPHSPVSQFPKTLAPSDPGETKEASIDDFLWRVLEGALGKEKVAVLKHSPLDFLVTAKMAADFNESRVEQLEWGHIMTHVGEKIGESRRRWKDVHAGLDSLEHLAAEGVYTPPETTKTAAWKDLLRHPAAKGVLGGLGATAVAAPAAVGVGHHLIGKAKQEAQKAAVPMALASLGGGLAGQLAGGVGKRMIGL